MPPSPNARKHRIKPLPGCAAIRLLPLKHGPRRAARAAGFTTVTFKGGWAIDSLFGVGDVSGTEMVLQCPNDTMVTGFSAGAGAAGYTFAANGVRKSLIDSLQFYCSSGCRSGARGRRRCGRGPSAAPAAARTRACAGQPVGRSLAAALPSCVRWLRQALVRAGAASQLPVAKMRPLIARPPSPRPSCRPGAGVAHLPRQTPTAAARPPCSARPPCARPRTLRSRRGCPARRSRPPRATRGIASRPSTTPSTPRSCAPTPTSSAPPSPWAPRSSSRPASTEVRVCAGALLLCCRCVQARRRRPLPPSRLAWTGNPRLPPGRACLPAHAPSVERLAPSVHTLPCRLSAALRTMSMRIHPTNRSAPGHQGLNARRRPQRRHPRGGLARCDGGGRRLSRRGRPGRARQGRRRGRARRGRHRVSCHANAGGAP